MTERASEQALRVGGLSRRVAARLAWSLWALAVALTGLSLLLLAMNLSPKHSRLRLVAWQCNGRDRRDRGRHRSLSPTREPRGLAPVPVRSSRRHEQLRFPVRHLRFTGATQRAPRR